MVEAARKRRNAESSPLRSSAVRGLDLQAPLLDAIAASPDDPAPWSVYADLLQTADHPRGELISVMMERERQPSVRLLDAQRRQLTQHSAALLPTELAHELAVAWRRGFVSELRLDAPEQLADVQRDLSLRFVEAATLAIDLERWTEWRAALVAARMPWRRLRIELANASTELDVAPMLACAPALETLRISSDAAVALRWDDASGAKLELLVLVNAGEVASLDDAELPRLEELRLFGGSVASEDLRTSLCWNRLKRVVLAEAFGDEESERGPIVHVTAPIAGSLSNARDRDDDYDEPDAETTTAFVVIGQPIQPALLRKLAARMSIAQLSARVGTVRWLARPLTVIQFFGTADAELVPYGLAIALENVLDPAPPIALVEVDEDRAARFLVLGGPPTRGTHQGRPDEVVRRALDLALGWDPGSAVLQDLLEELAATPVECLIGDGATSQLTMIDPSTAPLVVPEDDEENEYDDDEYDDDGDGDDFDDGMAESYEEPPVPYEVDEDDVVAAPPAVTVTAAAAEIATIVAANASDDAVNDFVEIDEEPVAAVRTVGEDALEAPPERVELWLEFHDHWDDRAVAVDDEASDARWPDPERVLNEFPLDLERRVAEPSCARHARALEDCRGCDALHCPECGGEDWCATCFAALVEQAANDIASKRVP